MPDFINSALADWHYWLLIGVIAACTFFIIGAISLATQHLTQLFSIAVNVQSTKEATEALSLDIDRIVTAIEGLPDDIARAMQPTVDDDD